MQIIINYSENAFDTLKKYSSKYPKIFVITDDNVNRIYRDDILELENLGYEVFSFESSETQKNFQMISKILDFLLEKGVSRDSLIIGLGGGIVGDIAGFCSSIILRGIEYVNVPTTLLSMVDSSVGGKTGVNHSAGKNLIGSFYLPKEVIIDKMFLNTLDDKFFRDGLGEVIKYGFIKDGEILSILSKNLYNKHTFPLDLIKKCIDIKIKVVEDDFKENGNRMILNFGHTFGHAIEKYYDYLEYSHGEAIVYGMKFALDLSKAKFGLDDKWIDTFIDICDNYNLKYDYESLDKDKIIGYMRNDKKVKNESIRFIFLSDVENCVIDYYK